MLNLHQSSEAQRAKDGFQHLQMRDPESLYRHSGEPLGRLQNRIDLYDPGQSQDDEVSHKILGEARTAMQGIHRRFRMTEGLFAEFGQKIIEQFNGSLVNLFDAVSEY